MKSSIKPWKAVFSSQKITMAFKQFHLSLTTSLILPTFFMISWITLLHGYKSYFIWYYF